MKHRQTLCAPIEIEGIALHSGANVRMRLLPAEPEDGIVFVRTDLGGARIPAKLDRADPNEVLSGRPVEVALSNLSTLQCARRLGIPMIGSVVPDGTEPASDATSAFSSSLTVSRTVDHWFRYPLQGRAGFLRATPRSESIWTGDQIDIRNAPETDEDAYIADVLRGKLNHLHGEIRGQTIRITTRGCRSVDILLHGALIDLTAPITVFFNEKRRLSRKVTPTISTLAGATVPAAVISMGNIRGNKSAAISTALYPAIVAIEESTSILCARVILGNNSSAKAVIPVPARVRQLSGSLKGSS